MSDVEQLPHLLRLIDDDSERVQRAVAKALVAFGSSLEDRLLELSEPPDEEQLQQVRELVHRYHGDEVQGDEVQGHEDHADEKPSADTAAPLFVPGQLVEHRKYGYRGVVVAFDRTCQADDDWYFSNRSQPNRYQAWYHVLVHGSEQMTYAAQTSLQSDESAEQVVHPFVPHFFSAFSDGRYVRNDTPWPG
ncbi:MAG: heat shock protein HspQ [Gemmatimonadetes bacterium]|nr:heat shock protein HspQ [Gemmatimonadota bacterium]MBT4612896.1 heat shock protein HspQ [Gemmatimonadota bacterium]MBT5059786.1 heat shock protein HspQ [Gemmatimonadota bacterium]MBT5143018.1 heat shock protein HspQ [Gemmatimonadota bacterium]MBT5588284.1 heat shock protein HspQ [Gemmatimonadota bacterium]